ncbi:hypothetical protein [Amaricoccus sp.]|uniref:hypothetical protein n=1 Tax=Amaricoccus sp. TaxID=1872485 RepID=UPI001B5926AE|nr:hypothetical protein [Amaricoccus sp.]MBP7001704.1 hypothetical protein [Amaricoccus sp.]
MQIALDVWHGLMRVVGLLYLAGGIVGLVAILLSPRVADAEVAEVAAPPEPEAAPVRLRALAMTNSPFAPPRRCYPGPWDRSAAWGYGFAEPWPFESAVEAHGFGLTLVGPGAFLLVDLATCSTCRTDPIPNAFRSIN